MRKNQERHGVPVTALAAALLAAFGAAYAQDAEEIARQSKPDSMVEVGIGYVSDDNQRFGQYTGLREEGVYGLLGVDINRRDDATGTWVRFLGRDLGLQSRELRFQHERQGNWGYFIDFSQTPRYHPYTIHTTLAGIEGNTQIEGGAPMRDVQLRTRRDALTLGFSKQLGAGFDASVRFRNEEKNGTRHYGRSSVRFLVDPIDYTTQQWEGNVGYTGERLQLLGGYYGTRFVNANSFVEVTPELGFSPIGLPPDNQSHQLSLAGGYNVTPTTRGNFKLAYGRITQDETFFLTPRFTVPRTDLGGRIDTKLVQVGVASRPLPRLSLRADLRYEERDDKTPVYIYTTAAATSTFNGENEPRSFKTTVGKLEASYALPLGFRLTGGAERDERKRNTSEVRSVSHRDKTDETLYRVELRRSLSETLNGAISLVKSDREGSPWLTTLRNNGTLGSNLVHPIHLADRDREKVRAVIDWTPLEPLSLNFIVEEAKDEYSGRTFGPREGRARFYSIDASYAISDTWHATAWASRSDTWAEQATCAGSAVTGAVGATCTAALTIWEAKLRNVGDAIGFGIAGRPTAQIDVGAEVAFLSDHSEFRQSAIRAGTTAVPAIPDVKYNMATLRLFSKYALTRNSGVRLQYVFDRFKTDDFVTNLVYVDGTTLSQDRDQKVHFIGLAYYYEFK